jgi:hypothetical protein
MSFGQSANRLLFDTGWLDGTPRLGNEITYSTVVNLCNGQIEEFQLHRGLAGKIRQGRRLRVGASAALAMEMMSMSPLAVCANFSLTHFRVGEWM